VGCGISSQAAEFALFRGILQKLKNDWQLVQFWLDKVVLSWKNQTKLLRTVSLTNSYRSTAQS